MHLNGLDTVKRTFILGFMVVYAVAGYAQTPIAVPDGYAGYLGTTGGGDATPITVSTAAEFISVVNNNNPAVIVVNGRLNVGTVSIGSNKTIVGLDANSGLYGGMIKIKGSNYIIQNLTLGPSDSDVVEVSGATSVFITKCTFHDSSDELCSIVREADYVTVSWSKFYFDHPDSHSYAHLIGNNDDRTSDRGKLHVTLHHNWYAEGVRERMPRVRYGHVHIYNNYYNSTGNLYCIGTGVYCRIRVENSHFDNINRPWRDYAGMANDGHIGWSNIKYTDCSQPTYAPNQFPVFTPPYAFTMDEVDDVKGLVTDPLYGAGNCLLLDADHCETLSSIVYVDATEGEAGNTALASGAVFDATDDDSGSDNLWHRRAYATHGTVFEGGGQYGDTANTEDCPRLKTSVAVAEGNYDVYAYFWADSNQWCIRASLTDDVNELPLFLAHDANNPLEATVQEFDCNAVPLLAEDSRTLCKAYLGRTGVTSLIEVFIDDDPNHLRQDARSWYDGIGFQKASPKIVYVDAMVGDPNDPHVGNTTLADGSVLVPTEDDSGSDNLWRMRAFATDGTVLEAGGQYSDTANTEDCPRLVTSVSGLPLNSYEVFAYIWADSSQWRVRAGLVDVEGDLPLYVCNDVDDLSLAYAVKTDFCDVEPMLAEDNRFLWQVSLGITETTTQINVYIDDDPYHLTHNARTWFDGIGYKGVN